MPRAKETPIELAPEHAEECYRKHYAIQQTRGFTGDYVHFLEALVYQAYELVEAMKEANGPKP